MWALKTSSIVICAETGTVHHEHNADVCIPPASLTKMMTLYLTFKALKEGRLQPNRELPVSKHAASQPPTKLGLKAGTNITVRQAILGCVTKSANDAAVALAETLGRGSEVYFADLMTQQARKLGMTATIFKNASGLPNKQQWTTARDMAILSRALYEHFPEYSKVFKEQKFVYKGKVHPNHNHLLGKVQGLNGIKTGFTNASGFCLAASMVRDDYWIIAVVLGGENRFARDKKMVQLLETTYANLKDKQQCINKNGYKSIDDLIFALGPSEEYLDHVPQKKGRIQKATYSPNLGKVKSLDHKYETVDDLLKCIEEKQPVKNITQEKVAVKKSGPKKAVIKKAALKKNTQKKAVCKKAPPKTKIKKQRKKNK
ncbi:MAG TPA: serine hydrolase [Alphaproteobacteria bacterium]|nr:serine hydrolase [Alphaproteobacteria bacterium]